MLQSLQDLEKCVIGAIDGDIGQVKDLYFDEHSWSDASANLDRQHETALHAHCDRPPYWQGSSPLERKI